MKNANSVDALKVVMLEHVGESNYWEWYSITRDTTPQEAIKAYYTEMGTVEDDGTVDGEPYIEPSEKEWDSEGMFYGFDDDVRAYFITI